MHSRARHSPSSRLTTDPSFNIFHELMARRVRKLLLIFNPYDAFILEEGGTLSARIVNEYRGLNLSHPPRIFHASSPKDALEIIQQEDIDLAVTMPWVAATDCYTLGREMKRIRPGLPVVLLAHNARAIESLPENIASRGIDFRFIWSSHPEFLMALVKLVEDRLNVDQDTQRGLVRVLLLIEDSPLYRSSFLPLLYRELLAQTQVLLQDSLNQEHRLLRMRARPKILVADNYQDGMRLFRQYRDSLLGVISDTRFPIRGRLHPQAGIRLLKKFRKALPDLPLLLLSSDAFNHTEAEKIPAVFQDKNAAGINAAIDIFFKDHLGFGDFVCRLPDGREVDRAGNLHEFEKMINRIPKESLCYHIQGNHFANWFMARSEIAIAAGLHRCRLDCRLQPDDLRQEIVGHIKRLRKQKQQGLVTQFSARDYDPEIMDFVKIGNGAMGGKALGLAFMAEQLKHHPEITRFHAINVAIPRTLVITTDGFDAFVKTNPLTALCEEKNDQVIAHRFCQAKMPSWLEKELKGFLQSISGPLSVRSSSPLEDTRFRPYAGLFATYMIPNNHPDLEVRLRQLVTAVKLIYASARYRGPRTFSHLEHPADAESMAVIIQPVVGREYGDYLYPAVSGIAQSYNFYPVPPMQSGEGVARIALGLGKTVVDGENSLRFSPVYPKILPNFSTAEDILANAQRTFYALKIKDYHENLHFDHSANLEKRHIQDAAADFPVRALSVRYIAEEQRLRAGDGPGPRLLTFNSLLQYQLYPLPEVLIALLALGRSGMGCPVEMEFSMDFGPSPGSADFSLLQVRPMASGYENFAIDISEAEESRAFCRAAQAIGPGRNDHLADIIYVDPHHFAPHQTMAIAREIRQLNAVLQAANRPYLLIGPGRWGSADHWLGIPVEWQDISGVGAIIEVRNERLRADPSQGSHFFQNITSMAIPYVTVSEPRDRINWDWLAGQTLCKKTRFLRHIRLPAPFTIKIDGRSGRCVMLQSGA